MTNQGLAYCGLNCEGCEYIESNGCKGCVALKGKVFWGECALAKCCIEKGHDHCGQCAEFPCATLKEYSYDKEHGDKGERIRNLKARNAAA